MRCRQFTAPTCSPSLAVCRQHRQHLARFTNVLLPKLPQTSKPLVQNLSDIDSRHGERGSRGGHSRERGDDNRPRAQRHSHQQARPGQDEEPHGPGRGSRPRRRPPHRPGQEGPADRAVCVLPTQRVCPAAGVARGPALQRAGRLGQMVRPAARRRQPVPRALLLCVQAVPRAQGAGGQHQGAGRQAGCGEYPSGCAGVAHSAVGRPAAERRFHCAGAPDRGSEAEGQEWYLMGSRDKLDVVFYFCRPALLARLSMRACYMLLEFCTIYTRNLV